MPGFADYWELIQDSPCKGVIYEKNGIIIECGKEVGEHECDGWITFNFVA